LPVLHDKRLSKSKNRIQFMCREAKMKKHLALIAMACAMAAIYMPAALAQNFGSVKGVARDMDGKPIVGATVEFSNADTGRKYPLKTNGKGEYFSLGLEPGKYKVTLSQGDKQLDSVTNFPVQLGDNNLDFDLKKSQNEAAQQKGISPEQLKKMQEAQAKNAKEQTTVKSLNEKLAAATASEQAGDYDAAIATLTEATTVDPSRDLLWFKLGDAYRMSVPKQTDPAEKTKRLNESITDIEKAVDMKKKGIDAGEDKNPEAPKQLAAYYNNLGDSYAKTGNTDGAVKAYNQAAQLNPTAAGQYYFNLGATMTNANKANDPVMRKAAVEAFDKAIAADPTKPDSYYWKGSNLIGMATLKDDKMIAPDGTAEAFQKYLELSPTGPHAEEAKAMLAGIGASVETSYGTKKKATKK
jgi:tetratricopeptide (TPR) repeat protein